MTDVSSIEAARKLRSPLIAMCLAILLLSGCAIRLPKITATGERTALENQIVGSYKMIEEESVMVASFRAATALDSAGFAGEKRRALEAFRRQRFNADDIAAFLKEQTVGERNDGLLEIRPSEKYQTDSTYRALVDMVVGQENEDRRLVMRRIIELHPEIDPQDRAKVGQVYARLKREAAPSGAWFQDEAGNWKRK